MRPLNGQLLGVVVLMLLNACGGSGSSRNPTAPGGIRNNDVVASAPFQFNLSGNGRVALQLQGVNGSVVVTGAPPSSGVTISGLREVRSDSQQDAQAQLQQLQVEVEDRGTDIAVRTRQPQETGGRSYVVEYRLVVPASLALSIANVNGSLDIAGTNGDVAANLVNGRIEASLEVPPGGSARLTTVNGEITLQLPQRTSAAFSARVVNGTISLTGLTLTNATRTNTSLLGTLGTGNGTVALQTTNGAIRVEAVP